MIAERPRNVLLIFADELRLDALGCAGNPIVTTPHIDALASDGVFFTQAMVAQPSCTPNRASILTGVYPSALRSRMVGCRTPDDPRFLPRLLGHEGFRTASIGKIHLVPQADEPEALEQSRTRDGHYDYYGFREVDLVNGHGASCFGPLYTPWLREAVPDADQRKSEIRRMPHGSRNTYHYPLPLRVHSSMYIAEQTVCFLQEADDRPFFLHVSFPDPHWPFTVPEPYQSMYDPAAMLPPIRPITECVDMPAPYLTAYRGDHGRRTPEGRPMPYILGIPPEGGAEMSLEDWQQIKAIYYGMTTLVDQGVGRIMETLEETDLADSTLVVFVSDHGEHLGDHGYWNKGLPFDGILRTPLIFRGPGLERGRVLDGLASTLDVAPSILDLLGSAEPKALHGVSMRAALEGSGSLPRTVVLCENDPDFLPRKERTLITPDWKLTVYANAEYGLLFNRADDPQETVNLWNRDEHREVRSRLYEMLVEELLCSLDAINGRVQKPAPPLAKWVPRHRSM